MLCATALIVVLLAVIHFLSLILLVIGGCICFRIFLLYKYTVLMKKVFDKISVYWNLWLSRNPTHKFLYCYDEEIFFPDPFWCHYWGDLLRSVRFIRV